MWKLYRRRHLWLLRVFGLVSAWYNYLNHQGAEEEDLQLLTHHREQGRHLLEHSASNVVPSCVPPSIDEFPDDFLSQEQRLKGGIIVHVLIVGYVCTMLAIVCDRYFVPSLEVIASYFKVPPDIAGATFMAIGTSSPELFSSVIGAFITEGDIGVGTVVGSAVFNILAVTGASGLAVGAAIVQLDWYPITRDCLMYMLTITSLVVVIHDNVVTWIESCILLSLFLCYLFVLYFNSRVQRFSIGKVEAFQQWWMSKRENNLLSLPKTVCDETSPLLFRSTSSSPPLSRYNSQEDSACPTSGSSSGDITSSGSGSDTLAKESSNYESETILYVVTEKGIVLKEKESANEDEEEISVWNLPSGKIRKALWVIMWPANFLFYVTIPDCSRLTSKKWFPVTFFVSVLWLGVLSYMSFWMVAIIGYTLGIPDTVSGLTILAAGTSVPELVSSIIVVRNGLGNMAICNLIGSNIFDILFCLGAPWLIKTVMNTETRSLVINSSALTYTTLILLSTVVLFYLSLLAARWRLSWRVGIVCLLLYSTFLVLASLYETNIFGEFNPPPCSS